MVLAAVLLDVLQTPRIPGLPEVVGHRHKETAVEVLQAIRQINCMSVAVAGVLVLLALPGALPAQRQIQETEALVLLLQFLAHPLLILAAVVEEMELQTHPLVLAVRVVAVQVRQQAQAVMAQSIQAVGAAVALMLHQTQMQAVRVVQA